ncbi:hypothetical protein PIB30_080507 [Stylosanthes scabra]|uniref:Uncharacterized protein n=1 Tax=Stylosanthes scabra TaxID=79078 RepID=A0ABU6SS99_9FABA|nr:hypothetical protein [Stylosanthes scabra]
MGSGIIYYEIEKREKYEDSDERADSDLAIVKMRRYHFDDEFFIHILHSIQFDLDCPYELPVESLLALRCRDPSKKKDSSLQESSLSRRASPTPQYSFLGPIIRLGSPSSHSMIVSPTQGQQGHKGARQLKSWELIPPSEGWMYDGGDIEGKKVSEKVLEKVDDAKGIEEEEEEEDPEDDAPKKEMPVIPRPMDVDADVDVILSTFLSIVVKHFLNIHLMTHHLSLLMPKVSPALTFPVFGRLQLRRGAKYWDVTSNEKPLFKKEWRCKEEQLRNDSDEENNICDNGSGR